MITQKGYSHGNTADASLIDLFLVDALPHQQQAGFVDTTTWALTQLIQLQAKRLHMSMECPLMLTICL